MKMRYSELPVSFTVVDEVKSEDTRFLKIVIDVLHTGLNENGSIFLEDVVNEALPSIQNTPILGYILVNDDGDTDDFTKHEYRLVKTSDGYRYMYAGSAYGVIPESCSPRWITKMCSDGKIRKFLQVDALLWTKFDRAVEIFERDIVKGQSMELEDNFEGEENPDGTFTFTKFLFNGCCILSTSDPHIQPAMVNSTATAVFSADSIAQEIKSKLEEYCSVINMRENDNPRFEKKSEGGKQDLEDLKQDIVQAPDGKASGVSEPAHGNFSAEGQVVKQQDDNSPVQSDFALNSNFMNELIEALEMVKYEDEYWGVCPRYSYCDYDAEKNEVYAWDREDWKLYGFAYTTNGDGVAIDFGSKARKKFVIVDFEEGAFEQSLAPLFTQIKELAKQQAESEFSATKEGLETSFNELKVKYEKLETDYAGLVSENNARQEAANAAAKEEIFSKFEKELAGEAEFIQLKETAKDFAVEDIETKCFAMVGRKKANFSARERKTPDKVMIPGSVPVPPNPYGTLFDD